MTEGNPLLRNVSWCQFIASPLKRTFTDINKTNKILSLPDSRLKESSDFGKLNKKIPGFENFITQMRNE